MSAPARTSDKPKPWVNFLTPPNPGSKTGGRTIVLGIRPYRSKYTTLMCFCRRRRADGSCRTLDGLMPLLRDPSTVRLQHPKIDEQTFRVPAARLPAGERASSGAAG